MRHIRFLLFIAIAAVAGAVAGRVAAQVRRQQESGEPIDISLSDVKIRAQDLIPGLVAAARVRDTPWSWLHIPSWMAAFGVNFGVGAVGGDLSRIREMAERAAFSFAGIEIDLDHSDDDEDFDGDDEIDAARAHEAAPDVTPLSSTTPFAPRNGSGSVTWTSPGPAERRDAPAGFTAFSE
ncbi:MAG: hypothetical protein DWI58_01450 [Chloroflexi bacterium]|nr:MAG: hypothetical protein DWI58_01450 [Chloroflexota bacterium]